ncbi:helix-turn-helix domain-containing protein [Puia sp. P3]|uniref:helix-turn-helix domain-containing protein n=1 Tax=Puia sp. P3 TaxID=3423952 RepID=UPI003D66B3EA
MSTASPLELINTARIKKAAEMITRTDRTIAEVAAMVGFHSRSNFGKAFYKQFHLSPTAYRYNNKQIS